MLLYRLTAGPLRTNTYVVGDEATREALIIDAGAAEPVLALVKQQGLHVLYLINTHGHWDHAGENERLRKTLGCRVAVHAADAGVVKADFLLGDGDVVRAGSVSLRVLHTPGHTPGSICLFEEKQGLLFSGDTLFKGTFGRTDFEGGSDADMLASLKRLALLPKNTRVFPGHGEPTAIGEEKWLPTGKTKSIEELDVSF
ncbi:MAG: MBL fold metallo-hydrolase [Candidatus Micrarchaeia archaeon]